MHNPKTYFWHSNKDREKKRYEFPVMSMPIDQITGQTRSYMLLTPEAPPYAHPKSLVPEVAQYLLGHQDERIKVSSHAIIDNLYDNFGDVIQGLRGLSVEQQPYVLCLSVDKKTALSYMEQGKFHQIIHAAAKYTEFSRALRQADNTNPSSVAIVFPLSEEETVPVASGGSSQTALKSGSSLL